MHAVTGLELEQDGQNRTVTVERKVSRREKFLTCFESESLGYYCGGCLSHARACVETAATLF